jgi:glycosyltransferase involved in cell wall biosynthesis
MNIFVISGTLPKSLTKSKITPLVLSNYVTKVTLFSQASGLNIEKCEVLCFKPSGIFKGFADSTLFRIITYFFKVLQIRKRETPDLIFGIYTLPYGFFAFICGKLLGLPVAVKVIGGIQEINTYYPIKIFWRTINLWFLRKCDFVLVKGSVMRQFLIENEISPDKIFIFTGGVNISKKNINFSYERTIDIIFIGSYCERKGPDRFVRIMKRLNSKIPSLRVFMLGDGNSFTEIKKIIETNKLTSIIKQVGYVDDVYDYLFKSKLFILPSRSEGLSTAMMEAMFCGVVPVVSNAGSTSDGVIHGSSGFLVDDYMDINTYVKYALDLLTDQDKWSIFSRNAIKFAKKNWSYEAETARWDKLLALVKESSEEGE